MGLGNRIGKFLELGDKETIHVVGVWVEAARGAQSGVKAPFSEAGKALLAEVQAGGHQPHVPLFQGIVYHPLILFHRDRAGAVDQVASGLGGSIDGVNSTEQQFLLKVGTAQDVLLILSPRDWA